MLFYYGSTLSATNLLLLRLQVLIPYDAVYFFYMTVACCKREQRIAKEYRRLVAHQLSGLVSVDDKN
jgi:hypothetical protein